MLAITPSIPDICVRCGSDNLSVDIRDSPEDDYLTECYACGTLMACEDTDVKPTNVTASFAICPHCCTVDSIMVYGDQEVCQSCGLNPDVEDYPSEEIAHLWREGSRIRATLEKGRWRPGGNLGTFFRTFCGPHCSFADDCSQTGGQLVMCYSEYRDEIRAIVSPDLCGTEDDMSRRRKKRNKQKNQENKNTQNDQNKVVESLFACSSGGWYEKYMREPMRDSNETICTEGHTDRGSG